jgi:hypothetical protein
MASIDMGHIQAEVLLYAAQCSIMFVQYCFDNAKPIVGNLVWVGLPWQTLPVMQKSINTCKNTVDDATSL